MAIRFTCPHCNATTEVEEELVGQTGPCRSCGRPVVVEVDETAATPPPDPAATGAFLRATAGGSIAGFFVVLVASVMFLFVPLILPLVLALFRAITGNGNDLTKQVLVGGALTLVLFCGAGWVSGLLLMGVAGVFLRRSPLLLSRALKGATLGAFVPLAVVFLTLSIPQLIQRGLTNADAHEQLAIHWAYAMFAAPCGAVAGILLALVTAHRRRPGASDLANR